MSDEEVRRFVADIFNNSESIKQWREAAELARENRLHGADLLRNAVAATAKHAAYDGSDPNRWDRLIELEEYTWKAYKESL